MAERAHTNAGLRVATRFNFQLNLSPESRVIASRDRDGTNEEQEPSDQDRNLFLARSAPGVRSQLLANQVINEVPLTD